ncbi:MAG: nicotinate-nicotinamide nucleotide adenylyltransferase [Oscillospiraceae bacterium]|nr:nicotinate-nicotinamide nucleotide adenylyltransferase [Oscillospiraceae bacterium]
MMQSALDQLGAEKGFFVPTADKSLRRKMRRAGFPEEVFSEGIRMEMLSAMAEEDPRLEVTDVEFQNPKHWYAQETMGYIQQQYPEAELFFLIGSDNLENYARAFRLVEFLEKYRYAVVDRGDGDLDDILQEIPAAWERRDRFCYVTPPEGIENISSTLIREKVRNNEPGLEELLHPCVMDMIRRDNRC